MYDYKKSKDIIEQILSSTTKIIPKTTIPVSDYEYSFTNGVKTWIGCMFIDIAGSHHIFENADEDTIRIMRALFSELIKLLKDNKSSREIGIRDDCIYSIYDLTKKDDLATIFDDACKVNTFMKMFNKILKSKGFEPVTVGIGLGCDYELIVKVGEPHNGIKDKLWIGNAIGHASYLSNVANRDGFESILMSTLFYDNVMKVLNKNNEKYQDWIKPFKVKNVIEFYQCNLLSHQFNQWIEQEL